MRTDDSGVAAPREPDIPSVMQQARAMLDAPAVLSDDQRHRFWLSRDLGPNPKGLCLFAMLNPSTADADVDDPTIRRCKDFARRWGFSRLGVINVFSLRAADPDALKTWDFGADSENVTRNATFVVIASGFADLIVCAWGQKIREISLAAEFPRSLGRQMYCLGKTSKGYPKHPLYVHHGAKLVEYP